MNHQNNSSPAEIDANDSQSPVSGAVLSSDALARRRMLLKSLAKGTSVAVAATASSNTLAGGGTLTFTASGSRCTMSGTVSGIHSKDTTKGTCAGRNPSAYTSPDNWPSSTYKKNSSFSSVFGGGSSESLKKIMGSVTQSNVPPEAVWITALLNSLPTARAINFPYTSSEVIGLYKDPKKRDGAFKFFRDFMQTLP